MARRTSFLPACLLAAALAGTAAAADLKVGYVNTQRVFREAPAAMVAAKKLEQDFSRREQELRRLGADIQARQDALQKDGVVLAESERRAREREIADLTREVQRKEREYREDLNLRQNEENMALIEKANRVIEQMAEAEKYDLILQEAVWAGPGIDITDKVIKALSEGK